MNKADLIKTFREETKITKSQAERIVDIFFGKMTEALANGDRVEIRGFCSFYVKDYKGYAGRNPKTGEVIPITSKKLPFFKTGTELKKRVDYQEI